MNIEKNIERIKLFGLTADVKTPNGVRHFYQGHEYVEIGGTKWATMNIGANSLIDNGLYFAWGETQGYSAEEVEKGLNRFNKKWYKWYVDEKFIKYNNADGLTTLVSEDDAMTTAWGDGWRMPTRDEFLALGEATASTWVTDYQGSGVNGCILTDKLDKSKVLFFPAAGFCGGGNVDDVGSHGFYWSSSLDSEDVDYAFHFGIHSRCMFWNDYNSRYYGFSLRGVIS